MFEVCHAQVLNRIHMIVLQTYHRIHKMWTFWWKTSLNSINFMLSFSQSVFPNFACSIEATEALSIKQEFWASLKSIVKPPYLKWNWQRATASKGKVCMGVCFSNYFLVQVFNVKSYPLMLNVPDSQTLFSFTLRGITDMTT